jgi:ribonucleoside-diphosphate reductase alpha chain
VVESSDRYTRTQASACFIISIQDKLMGEQSISEQYITETRLFKGGSGTGTNFSTLRAEGERLSGGGYSSGLLSFLKGFDKNAGAIKSGGTTRRAAKMVIVDDDHPDIMEFRYLEGQRGRQGAGSG